MEGNACTHQHIANTGQHGSVERGQVRQLHLLKEIDAHIIGVVLASQKDFDKVRHHAQFNQLTRLDLLVHSRDRVGSGGRLAAGDKVLLPDSFGHFGKRKSIQSPAHVAA